MYETAAANSSKHTKKKQGKMSAAPQDRQAAPQAQLALYDVVDASLWERFSPPKRPAILFNFFRFSCKTLYK